MGAKILLVDDNELIRELMIEILLLNESISEVDTADDGSEALEKAKAREYDLIISDISMPRLSGIDFIRLLRQQQKHTKVLVSSMKTDRPTIMNAFQAGVQGIIVKNAAVEEMHRAVNLVLNGENYFDPRFHFLPEY